MVADSRTAEEEQQLEEAPAAPEAGADSQKEVQEDGEDEQADEDMDEEEEEEEGEEEDEEGDEEGEEEAVKEEEEGDAEEAGPTNEKDAEVEAAPPAKRSRKSMAVEAAPEIEETQPAVPAAEESEAVVEAASEAIVEAPAAPVEAPAEPAVPERVSRLMIREIVLTNFKSYGNRKVIGPFHKSFSSIVGPNGSGKSNTIDALLFVFGKRAKKMRLNKVSELIHCSSALPNCPSAKVEVTFQDIVDTGEGPEDYAVVEGSILTIGREAFRNNQSKYYVEGKGSNFTEVTQLLRKRGVDLEHNRFLILQGEVEQISLMKPKALTPHEDGLLEYLEDIVGSNRFVEPITQAEEIVEKLTETRQEKLNRLRVAEREKEALDGPRKEAEAWVSAEAELQELLALIAQAEARRSHAKIAGLEQEHKKLQKHMEEHRKRMEGFEKQVKAIEDEHNTHLKEYNTVKVEMEKAALDFKEFERLDVKFTEDIAFHEQKLQKLQQAAQKEAENAEKLLKESERLREEAPTREQELESAERFKASVQQKLDKIYEGLKGKAEELRPVKEKKEAELVPLQKKLTDVRKVVEVAQTEANLIREKTQNIADQIEDLKSKHADCGQRLKTQEQEAKDAAKLKGERTKLVQDARERLQGVTSQMEEVSKEVAAARIKAEEARTDFEKEHDRGRLIKAVYQMSKAGRLTGVHGRLGDLGTIGKKYDVAVSTACSMLDAIVVDSTEDAQKVIEFVRREDLGRTTCVCLDKIAHLTQKMGSVKTPEDAPRLVDLIKPSQPAYQVAFYFALRDTLVAQDLEQATRVGLQGRTRWRVVTLQGQLIDTSGTMSGGGGQVARGGMRASLCMYSPEEVAGLVQAYEKASARLVTIRNERRALEEAVQQTEKEISEYELREQKAEMEAGSLKKQVESYAGRLKTLTIPTLSADEKKKLKELEKIIAGRSDELHNIQVKHQAVEEEVRELHNQIMNIGGEELRVAKQKAEEAAKKVEDMRRNIKKALLDADNMVKNSKKAEENAKNAKQDRVKTEKDLAKLKEEHAKIDDRAEVVINNYNKLKAALADKDQIITKLRGDRDKVIEDASQCKSQEVDLINELDEKTKNLKDLYASIEAWQLKLKEARKEYEQIPLDILGDLRTREAEEGKKDDEVEDVGQTMARRAIKEDLPGDILEQVVRTDVEARVAQLQANVQNLKPNLSSIEEFRRADSEHKSKLADYEAVHNEREEARRKLEELKQNRLEQFMDGFSVISMKLKEMYQMITLGGDAELELVDTLDPFSEGINFSVRPPKKSWKQITNLSGGEKTLASLSLVFALHHYKPTPLYFMDEIDAALDFRNVSIIANYIKERTKNAQFIVISLRNHMFEMADLLVGIYKTQDISKSVAIEPTAFEVKPVPAMQARPALTQGDGAVEAEPSTKRPVPLAPLEGPPPAKKQRRPARPAAPDAGSVPAEA